VFNPQQKQEIAAKVQQILRDTGNPALPDSEIQFALHVAGANMRAYDTIRNSTVMAGAVNGAQRPNSKAKL
jgi:hypothetical protein